MSSSDIARSPSTEAVFSSSVSSTRSAEIRLLAAMVILFLLMFALPYAKYLFLLSFAILSVLFLRAFMMTGDKWVILPAFSRLYAPHLLVAAGFLVPFVQTEPMPQGLLKEAVALVVVLLMGLALHYYLRDDVSLAEFERLLIRIFPWCGALVLAVSAVKFHFMVHAIEFKPLMTTPLGQYPPGSSLLSDYNYYALTLMLCFATTLISLRTATTVMKSRMLQILLFLFAVNIVFTSSRRSLILLISVHGVLAAWSAVSFLRGKGALLAPLIANLRLYAVLMLLFGLCTHLFLAAPEPSRERILSVVGLEGDSQQRFMDSLAGLSSRYVFIDVTRKAHLMSIADTRSARYREAWAIFSRDYSRMQMLFGEGFGYISRYSDAHRARNELATGLHVDFDYPHNPLLSSLLYGGAVGFVIIVVYFMATAFAYCSTMRRSWFFLVWQVIIFFYAFFSGNSIFSTPQFVMLSFFPFLYQFDRRRLKRSMGERPTGRLHAFASTSPENSQRDATERSIHAACQGGI